MGRDAGSAEAWARLYMALEQQAGEGRWPACANPSLRQLWFSEARGERAEAAL